MSKRRPELRCYCCGEPVGERIALVALRHGCDRVFVLLPEHVDRVSDAVVKVLVRR